MPGFLKFDVDMHAKPEIDAICEAVGLDEDAVVGKVMRVFVWVDRMGKIENGDDGDGIAEGTLKTIDRQARCGGFGEAMKSVGWVDVEDGVLRFKRLGKYGSDTARMRYEEAERKRLLRRKQSNPSPTDTCPDNPGRASGQPQDTRPDSGGLASGFSRTKGKGKGNENEKGTTEEEERSGNPAIGPAPEPPASSSSHGLVLVHPNEIHPINREFESWKGSSLSLSDLREIQAWRSGVVGEFVVAGRSESVDALVVRAIEEAKSCGRSFRGGRQALAYVGSIVERCIRQHCWPGKDPDVEPEGHAAARRALERAMNNAEQ